jgi:hypothetical protein
MRSWTVGIACLISVCGVQGEPAATQEGRVESPAAAEELKQVELWRDRGWPKEKRAEYEAAWKRCVEWKASGKEVWGERAGVKTAEYYKTLSTKDLADEVLLSPVVGIEGGLYNDPMYALIKLEVLHPGVEELFARSDMGAGVVHIYDSASAKLKADSDLQTVIRAMIPLSSLGLMMKVPKYRQYVNANKEAVLAAQIQALERMSAYLKVYNPDKLGTKTPFFGEATSVAGGALALAKEIDPATYAGFEKEIRAVRWGKEQNIEDLKAYLTLVIRKLNSIAVKEVS